MSAAAARHHRLLLLQLLLALLLLLVPGGVAGAADAEISANGDIAATEERPRIPTMQALAVMRYLRAAEDEVNAVVAAAAGLRQPPAGTRPPAIEKHLGPLSGCLASLRRRNDPRPLLQSLVTLWPPLEHPSIEEEDGGSGRQPVWEGEEDWRPPKEAALLELALKASVFWGVDALWAVFDPMMLEDAATDNDPPPKPIPVISADWTEPTPACRRAVDAAVRLQQKGDVGFFELWPEAGPLGNPLQKRTEGAFHDHGPRTCMGHGRKLVNETDGRLSAFGLALCGDDAPAEGMVASGVIKNLGSEPVCGVTLNLLQLPPYWQDDVPPYDFEAFPPPPPRLLTEWRLEGYLPPQGFFVVKVQASDDFPPQSRYALGLLGHYFPCLLPDRTPDTRRPLAWAPLPVGSAFAPKPAGQEQQQQHRREEEYVSFDRLRSTGSEDVSRRGVVELVRGAVGAVWGTVTGRRE